MNVSEMIFWQSVISLSLVILMKICVFFIGYCVIRLGYKLLILGVKGEFKFKSQLGSLKTDLVSVSPGLLFVLLGVILIGYAIFIDKPVESFYPEPSSVPKVEIPGNDLGNSK